MGIMYTNKLKVVQLEGFNLNELETISDYLDNELYEFYQYTEDNTYGWHQKNGCSIDVFEKLSKKHQNVLFEIKSARTEDFNFNDTDVEYYWVLNGHSIKSLVKLVQVTNIITIDNWIAKNTSEHIHDFDTLATKTSSEIVMRCKCGETKTFKSTV